MSNDINCLRGKYVLVCRTSGVHRLPIYQRVASKGPWAEPEDRSTSVVCPWAYTSTPLPNSATNGGYGAKLVFLHPSINPPFVSVAHDWIIEDTSDASRCVTAVRAWIARQGPDFPGFSGVACFDEFSLTCAAQISEALGLTGFTPLRTINAVRNKLRMREICTEIGLPQPRAMRLRISDLARGVIDGVLGKEGATRGVNAAVLGGDVAAAAKEGGDEDLHKGLSRLAAPNPRTGTDAEWLAYYSSSDASFGDRPLQYPLVVKPLSGAGSNFVRKVESFADLVRVLTLFAEQCDEVNSQDHALAGSSGAGAVVAPGLSCPSAAAADAASDTTTDAASDAAPTGPAAPQSLLMFKWRHWGLSHLDSSFMVEEFVHGEELDLDMIVQRGGIKILSVNYNFPTAGHREYFMEAGGIIPAPFPLRVQIAARVLGQRFVSAFGKDVSGALHFEGIVGRNAAWAEANPAWVAAGLAGDGFCVMPIEVNQRLGGSEVGCLDTVMAGVDVGVEAIKVACGIDIPNYFSLLPGYEYANRLGWDRVPGALPLCDVETRALYSSQAAPGEYAVPTLVSPPSIAEFLQQQQQQKGEQKGEQPEGKASSSRFVPCEPLKVSVTGVPVPVRAEPWDHFLSRQFAQAAAAKPEISYEGPAAVAALATAAASTSAEPSAVVCKQDGSLFTPASTGPLDGGKLSRYASETEMCPPLHLLLPRADELVAQPANQKEWKPCKAISASADGAGYESVEDLLAFAQRLERELGIPTPTATYPPGNARRFKYVVSINFVPPTGGVVKTLHLPHESLCDPYYLGSGMWYQEGKGQVCDVPPVGFDFLGWLVAGGDTAEEAQEHLHRIAAQLRWEIEQ